jgi:hypothetical protein
VNPLGHFQQLHRLTDREAAELVGLSAREWGRQKLRGRPSRQTAIILLIIQTYGLGFWLTARSANGAQLPTLEA